MAEKPSYQELERNLSDAGQDLEISRVNEQKYRAAFEGSHDAITLTTREGVVLDCNRRALDLFGLQGKDDFSGTRPADFSPPFQLDGRLSVARSRELVDKVLREGKSHRFEWLHQRSTGEVFPAEIILSPVKIGNREVVQASIRDITERRRTEESLRRRNLYLETLNEITLGLIQRMELDELFQTIAARALELAEAEEAWICVYDPELEAVVFKAVVGPNARLAGSHFDRERGMYGEMLRTGTTVIVEDYSAWPERANLDHYDKRRACISIPLMYGTALEGTLGIAFHDPSRRFDRDLISILERLTELASICLDNTRLYDGMRQELNERKQAEVELRQRESLLARIFEILPVGLWFADRNGKLLKGNPAGVKIWGAEPLVDPSRYGVFKARRLPSGEEVAPDDWALVRAIRGGVTTSDELLEIDAFDGKKKTILNYAAPVTDDNGDIEGAVVVNQDITELERLHVQLNQAQKMESVGRLAGGVAHDFNNMLGIILGHTDMALEYLEPGRPVHSDLTEIRKATMRSADLVRQLLAFARKQTIAPKVLDLNDTVEGMLKMLRRLIGEDIELSWMPGKNLRPVNMDPTQIDQILANLCVNARDAIDGVGKVMIETDNVTLDEDYCAHHAGSVPGDYVLLAVSDDGCGMDEEILDKIFDPFFTTKEVGKGTGLGLPMVYGIVKQNEGFINVYSEPGRGTTISIYIPGHTGEVEEAHKRDAEQSIAGGSETILLVEDEPMLLQMGKDMLRELGYRVLAAGSPSEALRIAAERKEDIRLLITDVIMPGMNGRELADRLSEIYPGMKLVFMSGYTADAISRHGVLEPGVEFLQKPFSMKELATGIRKALSG